MKRPLFVIVIALPLFAGCGERPVAPYDRMDAGLIALRWGMSPGEAMEIMERYPGLTLVSDTTVQYAVGYMPFIVSDDSTEVYSKPYPDRLYRSVTYTGGTFLGYDVRKWGLRFNNGGSLTEVRTVLDSTDTPNRTLAVVEDFIKQRYVFHSVRGSNDIFRYVSRGIGGSPDSTGADTYLDLRNPRFGGYVFVDFTSRAYVDSVDAEKRSNPRIRVWNKEYEKMEREWKEKKGKM